MDWLLLITAGAAEVGGVMMMKASNGFKKLKPTIAAVMFGVVSFYCLSQAMRSIPIGTSYGVWTGIGSAGSVLLGMLVWGETFHWRKLLLLLCIIVGVVGLKMT
ncbi:DMT family transporter [Paenibacillus chartarius]|uniref:DMT family transporter n=1 Tax=Paenibacillus chartarius TaxID=747481 RepID=A0ABV6DF87_9BACL